LDAVWLFWVTGIIPSEERFTGYYPPKEDLFPGEGGFTGNYQPNEVGITGEDFLAGNSRPQRWSTLVKNCLKPELFIPPQILT